MLQSELSDLSRRHFNDGDHLIEVAERSLAPKPGEAQISKSLLPIAAGLLGRGIENYLKGYLVQHNIEVGHTHKLGSLAIDCHHIDVRLRWLLQSRSIMLASQMIVHGFYGESSAREASVTHQEIEELVAETKRIRTALWDSIQQGAKQ